MGTWWVFHLRPDGTGKQYPKDLRQKKLATSYFQIGAQATGLVNYS